MKTKILSILTAVSFTCALAGNFRATAGPGNEGNQTIKVWTIPSLNNLAEKWASEYTQSHPATHVDIVISGQGTPVSSSEGIGITSNPDLVKGGEQSPWTIVAGRDVVVPVMNAKNPLLAELKIKGIKASTVSSLIGTTGSMTWGSLLETANATPLHLYMTNEESVGTGISRFLGSEELQMNGIKTLNGNEITSAIQNDIHALGFCRLSDIVKKNDPAFPADIAIVPVDKNGNGRIDFMEDIYGNLREFTRGVWIGKYPKALCGYIYLAAPSRPDDEAELSFMRWVLTDGQEYLSLNGYSDLVTSERHTQLDKLTIPPVSIRPATTDTYARLKVIGLVLAGFIILGFVTDILSRYFRSRRKTAGASLYPSGSLFAEDSLEVPGGLFFDKTHTWAFMEKDGHVKVGIDDFMQHVTGPLTRIEMLEPGVKVKKGDRLLTLVQKGKQLHLYAPVSGTITEKNAGLATDPAPVRKSPYSEGWIYSLAPANWFTEMQFLSTPEKYKEWIHAEFTRLKDFFLALATPKEQSLEPLVLQDGGSLKEGCLADLGPESWEDFQNYFIDNAK